jgi:hypothetical protein
MVERYYVANAADAAASNGVLPVGSVTYRVYADMLPGYKFQAAYATSSPINHPLSILSTTAFYNNESGGNYIPSYTKAQAAGNTLMLDSWLTVGAACKKNGADPATLGYFGVLKTEDNGVNNVVNSGGLLQNNLYRNLFP